MSFILSSDQQAAIDGIYNQFISADTDKPGIAVLTGSAGTGKTTVLKDLLKRLWATPPLEVVLCATTHRAAEVLRDITGQPVVTAHSAFKLKPGVTKYGKPTINPGGVCKIPYGSIVVIDESSMIGNQFLAAITKIVHERALKLLFVGDPFQLPPPTDRCSLFDGSLATYRLTKVHRQAYGNPILAKAVEYREFIEGSRQTTPTLITDLNTNNHGIHVMPHADFVSSFVKHYLDYDASKPVEVPMCTYTNESAINYNALVRKSAYFLEDTIQPYYPGERLVSNSIVQVNDATILSNNEIVIVQDYWSDTWHDIKGYTVRVLGARTFKGASTIKNVFVPLNPSQADTVLNQLKNIAIAEKSKSAWVNFYEIKNSIADLRPPFAGTTHKAQGGTFPSVFIDQVNIAKCRDPMIEARLMYVALTRASNNVYVNSK